MLVGDLDGERSNACATRLSALGANAVQFVGPATETVVKMAATIPQGALCIAFVDPYNLALLDFRMLRTLAQIKNIDLIVHFSTMDLLRNTDMELDPTRARFDDMAPGWRDQPWASNSNKHNLTVAVDGYWRSLLEGLGFSRSEACPLITNGRRQGIYRLMFFARHDLPLRLWGDVARNPNGELF